MSKPVPLERWRLVLGRFAERSLDCTLVGDAARRDRALEFLYAREYVGRGVRAPGGAGGGADASRERAGSLGPSTLTVPRWLDEVRELFPRETAVVVERHALERYGLTEILTDPETLRRVEPSVDLLASVLSFRGRMKGPVLDELRRIVRRVVEQIRLELEPQVRRALAGRVNRYTRSPLRVSQNFDWRGTIRENLRHYDAARGAIVIQQPRFFSRIERRFPWRVILCIDQSGSMASSVIHSAVLAAILAALPFVDVKLVVFDTSVVDLSGHADDPVEVLMNVQLGGGTDIGRAVTYCESLVSSPRRTALVLVSDFCEGASSRALIAACRRLAEARVTLLGLAALDASAEPAFDRAMAERLAAVGMEIAALTPGRFAEWLARVMR